MEQYWFIDQGHFTRYQAALASGETGAVPSERVDEIRANADRWAKAGYASENLSVRNGEAHISVGGVLLQNATFVDELYARYLGEAYSTYPGIMAQIKAAEANPGVDTVVFDVDSPGGMMSGVDECAQAIAGCAKRTEARVGWMAASAAYYLASQTDKIVATTPSASVGSIGVVVDIVDATAFYESKGIKFYSLTSSDAPNKRKEPHSDEFKEQVRSRLDDLHAVFADRVAEGRSRASGKDFTRESVNENFGRGGLLVAGDAMAVGMLDEIEPFRAEAKSAKTTKEVAMSDEKTTVAVDEGQIDAAVERGVQQERARVAALLPWMDADSERVERAITEGEELTPALMAELSNAAREKIKEASPAAAADEREADEAPVVTGVDVQDESSESEKVVDNLVASVKALKGGK